MNTNFEPCPICGNVNIDWDMLGDFRSGDAAPHAMCYKCGASAPIDEWNDRTKLADTSFRLNNHRVNYGTDSHGA